MRARLLLALALLPSTAGAQRGEPPPRELVDAIAGCLFERLDMFDENVRLLYSGGTWIDTADGTFGFTVHREWPYQGRGVPDRKLGGYEVAYWFDDDPLSPPIVFKYNTPTEAGESRDISADYPYRVGVGCFEDAYPRSP